METDNENLIWFAGFFDGEGTIGIKRFRRKGHIDYTIYASCSQVDKPKAARIIESFEELFGGHVYRYTQNKHKETRLDTIQWSATANKCRKFLTEIRPYLRFKDSQCDIALEFIKGLNQNNSPIRLSDEERKRREGFFDKMRTLNAKGRIRLQRLSEKTLP